METEEILEGNKLIAEFMGSKYVNTPFKQNKEDEVLTDFWNWTKPDNGFPRCCVTDIEWSTCFQIGNFKYHSSFDWLMPVINRIEELGYFCVINRGKTIVCLGGDGERICLIEVSGKTKILNTWKAIIEFIHNAEQLLQKQDST